MAEQPDRLTRLTDRLTRFERTARRQRILNAVLVVALVVAVSGWWLTARDQAATRRNGTVADCRADALAVDLDAFRIIVSPAATDAEILAAAARLERIGPLVDRYHECTTIGGTP